MAIPDSRSLPHPVRVRRCAGNPIVTPRSVSPSRPELTVVGTFNPGVTRVDGEIILLLRVAEAPRDIPADEVAAPLVDRHGRLHVKRWRRDGDGVDASDPRLIVADGRTWLTSISHLRVARSTDGVHFEVEATPALTATGPFESFGIEDPRITVLDGTYWINYTAVSPHGIATALASTRDFRTFERHGVIFPPSNRDVTIFPERIDGRYVAHHRPMPADVGRPAIWAATSSDLRAWGDHRLVADPRPNAWDDGKIGGGAVPFRVRTNDIDGWLAIYHGVSSAPFSYSLGALLLDGRDPARVIARSADPILSPDAPYEREGFFGGVVFSCGVVVEGSDIRVYYGAADGVTALADLPLDDVLATLRDEPTPP